MIIQLRTLFTLSANCKAVEVGEVAAVDVMPRVVAVKNSLEGKHHIVGIHFTSGSKPVGFFETEHRDAGGSDRSRRCRVLPSFRQVPASGDRYRDRHPAVDHKTGRQGYRQLTHCSLWMVKGVDLPADAIDKTAVADISMRGGFRRGDCLTTHKSKQSPKETIIPGA
ncbi:Uncharacterised protein [Escherichia coli]|uniref:Uncharacterized protein n=1 Tax=Escherichia coli TaxID=562 RepID=A0A2X3K6R0_ECOLX|nr:Uncharacterised protein [Escherichia coli]